MIHSFKTDISKITKPEKFTFPFYYDVHPLAEIAAQQLQDYLTSQTDFVHNFGLRSGMQGMVIGKMFGVLVVESQDGQIGYLQAFSGKLAEKNHHIGFVPPVFDMLKERSFFKVEEEQLNAINQKIEALEAEDEYLNLKTRWVELQEAANKQIDKERKKYKNGKKERKELREKSIAHLTQEQYQTLENQLKEASIKSHFYLKDQIRYWQEQLDRLASELEKFKNTIKDLKSQRKRRSAKLQDQLFQNYKFKNYIGEEASLLKLFENSYTSRPPAGAGECAAPKLLQFAFSHGLKPICMAEFWWGASPSAEVRKSGHFYPACQGKCKPILSHMLSHTPMDEDPLQKDIQNYAEIKIHFDDSAFAIIEKPAELLSVPGKHIKTSVYSKIRERFPDAEGPLIVHRLDMSTSGLMVIAKNLNTYKKIQKQFIERQVEKTYVAVLDGTINEKEGLIDLPLRVDLDDRPRQLVCYKHGRRAITKWQKIGMTNGKTLVHFFPVTGRTHQLRVHAAHKRGLNCPILGDDLYGRRSERLHLHAAILKFNHPITRERLEFISPAPFDIK